MSLKKNKPLKIEHLFNIGIAFRGADIVITKCSTLSPQYHISTSHTYTCNPNIDNFKNLDKALMKLPYTYLDEAKVSFMLPCIDTEMQNISLPNLTPEELISTIENQIPNSKNYYWGEKNLGYFKNQEKTNNSNILIFKAKKEVIEKYIAIFDKHAIELEEITTEVSAVENLVTKKTVVIEQKQRFIIDLDFNHLKLYVFLDNELKFFRQISFGYRDIIKDLCRKVKTETEEINITEDLARKILADHDLFNRADTIHGLPLDHLFFLIRPSLEKMTIEIQKSIHFFTQKSKTNIEISELYMLGCFFKIKNIHTYLSEKLNITIKPLDIKEAIFKKRPETDLVIIDSLSLSFATGLSKRDSNESLLPKHYLNRPKKRKALRIILGIIALWAVLFLSSLGYYSYKITKIKNQIKKETPSLQSLVSSRDLLITKKNLNHDIATKFRFIKELDKKTASIAELVYALNLLNFNELYLNKLEINNSNIRIEGAISKDKSQYLLTKYIDNLSNTEFLSNINFQILRGDDLQSNFVITARLSPLNKDNKK
jgi:Tfp pilus assembly PilM family ATPase